MEAIQASGYSIYFNNDCYVWLYKNVMPDRYSKIFIIVDTNTATHCLPLFLQQLETDVAIEVIELEPGEVNKNIDTCIQVWHTLAELECDRKSLVINLGGGMVTDLGGFAASTFKRGIDFINIPTSLLAMVDAAVGGKTGVDLGALKNQIGVINNPVAVLVDTAYLSTLPAEEIRSGFAEMLKHGLITDEKYWQTVVDVTNLINDDLDSVIKQSVYIKNKIVLEDPTEKNIRKKLNFGHTLGHAIESYYLENDEKKTLLHGEAIAIGMILEAHISMQKGMLAEEEYNNIKKIMLGIFEKVIFTNSDVEAILKILIHDKKNEFGKIQFVLLQNIGNAVINQTVENALIYKAFEDYQT
ncbi:3-dehydroquinate synthase [Flavobacterium salilacus subsp. salilacus]|uniref:3-dehydroquinate synthase n=1 Tax=Flavobacterium TaxID=237 RepID=UPI0010754860|nr:MULTISPECIES: 3-dehydroquinate synthase [Flavobacterium]KAF2518736.1 3-dehydroquinate synthase [Flavobacterium salilacus subsp. salilacus]MBE1613702.1 3-dehydroquinate synthase [Flavobacterium sp. SaA2.13]